MNKMGRGTIDSADGSVSCTMWMGSGPVTHCCRRTTGVGEMPLRAVRRWDKKIHDFDMVPIPSDNIS